jgi:hypothetical protein
MTMEWRSDRGAALVFAILGLVVLTILGVGLTGIGMVAMNVTNNEAENAEALAIADAGVAHARRLLLWQDWKSFNQFLQDGNGTACDGDEFAAAPLSGGPYPTLPAGFPSNASDFIPATGRTFGNGRYVVSLCDDESTDVDPATGILDTNPSVDVNKRVLIRSTGFGRNGSSATLEAVIGAVDVPAILVNGSVEVKGNPTVSGTSGAIHANGDMVISGNPCSPQYFEATGDTTGGGNAQGGTSCTAPAADVRPYAQPMNVPILNPADFEQYANYKLDAAGNAYQRFAGLGSSWVLVPAGISGWNWQNGQKDWKITGSIPSGTYYVQGTDLTMTGSPGSPGSPIQLTLIVDGWVNISGSPNMVGKLTLPWMGTIGIIAGTDIDMSGSQNNAGYGGLYYAQDQIDVSGTPTINGQLVAANVADVPYPASGGSNLVPLDSNGRMVLSGNPTVTWNGGGMVAAGLLSWHECRGVDPANACGAP